MVANRRCRLGICPRTAAQELIIGTAMGFAMRLVFSAVDMAGNIVSLEMGLGFASAYDPPFQMIGSERSLSWFSA